jgi:hypothetical protein
MVKELDTVVGHLDEFQVDGGARIEDDLLMKSEIDKGREARTDLPPRP